MNRSAGIGISLFTALALVSVAGPHVVHGQSRAQAIRPATPGALVAWDNTINRMVRSRDLQIRKRQIDPMMSGRETERLDQFHDGVRVWGGNIARQIDGAETVSMFGVVYPDPAVATTPAIDADQAKAIIERIGGATLGADRNPELVILPSDDGTFTLAWVGEIATARDAIRLFLDARTGREIRRQGILERQVPSAFVGHGLGVLGDDKKVSTAQVAGGFVLFDTLRPPVISTFNMRGNLNRVVDVLNGVTPLVLSDYDFSSNNDWTDAAGVDAHVYSSETYDYYYKRFGRRGLDDADSRVLNFVHPVNRSGVFTASDDDFGTFYVNAFYYPPANAMIYGEGLPGGVSLSDGRYYDYFAGAIDVVAHELTHGVTRFTSNLEYEGESGALNESFSDIMGTSVEFFFQPAGNGLMKADYLIGEDIARAQLAGSTSGNRSMADPQSYGDPDHYSRRYVGEEDNGGVHTNSGISNNAFYLAIEGGTNRTSGIRVQGVGAANREQIEKIFYRAFTQLLPTNANFSMARAATLQAARDLYGLNSAPYNAVQSAWTAVGVN